MSLSQRLAQALSTRALHEELMSLYAVERETDGGQALAKRSIVLTTSAWLTFVQEFQRRVAVSAGSECAARDDRCAVGLLCAETFHACVAESACLCLGEAFCVFNPQDPPKRLEVLLQRRRPRVLLTDLDVATMVNTALTAARTEVSGCFDAQSLVSNAPDSALAYYIYTSGSTGEPKCVMVTRGNLLAYTSQFAHSPLGLSAGGGARVLCLSTPFFDPSIGDMASTMLNCAGGVLRCVVSESLLSGDLPQLLLAAAPTHVVSTPTVWRSLSSVVPALVAANLVLKVFLGGERVPQWLIDLWADKVELHNIYGVTEATVYQSVERVPHGTNVADISCGTCGMGALLTLELFRSRNAYDQGNGELEIVMRGAQVCSGYADAAPTEQGGFMLDENGEKCFRTGDIGEWREGRQEDSGKIVLCGRRDWQIKVNGQRTSLEEIEQTIRRVCEGSIKECCCCSITYEAPELMGDVRSATHAEEVVAHYPQHTRTRIGAGFVISGCISSTSRLHEIRDSLLEALQTVLQLYLPSHMIPQQGLFLPEDARLPQTATGKTDRRAVARELENVTPNIGALGAEFEEGLRPDSHVGAHEDQLSILVRSAWVAFFGIPSIAPGANFLHLGGDSLGALRLTRAVLVAVQGSDEGIDAYGGLPAPFQPFLLMTHPTLSGYTSALREAMQKDERFAAQASLLTSRAASAPWDPAFEKKSVDTMRHHTSQVFLDVVSTGSVALAEVLVRHRLYDVDGGNCREHRCATPLHVAARLPDTTRVEGAPPPAAAMTSMLLRAGAKPTCVTVDGVTPAHLAAASSCEALLVLLTHAPATVNCRDNRQQSLLHFAAREGQSGCVSVLLRQFHADLTIRDKWQRTAAHWAALNGHVDVLATMAAFVRETAQRKAEEGDGEPRQADTEGSDQNRAAKRPRRGNGRLRLERLAKKKTHLGYESLDELAQRMWPGDGRICTLAEELSLIVER